MASYTVTLDKQGGTGGTNSVTVIYGLSMPGIATPLRTGYSFIGYFDARNGEGLQYYNERGSSVRSWDKQVNTTLYAYWLPAGVICLGSNKNTTVKVGSPRSTQTYTVPKSDPDETPYNDIRDSLDWTVSVQAMETTLFVAWYTFPSDSSSWRDDYIRRATVFISSNPSLSYDDIINNCRKTSNGYFALIAEVATANGILAYNVNGGDPISPDYKIVPVDEAIGELPTPTRTGYQFSGWFTAASGGTRVTSSTTMPQLAYLIIYAHWTPVPVQYTLYFNASGGEVSEASRLVYSGTAYGALPTPTWAYHTFVGWFTEPYGGSQVSATTTMGDDDATIYAHWTDDTTTITFNGNGGEPSTQTITYPSGSKYGSLPSATRSGYILAGWFTATTGGTRVEPSDTVSAQTLYAQWQTSGEAAEGVIWNKDTDFVIEIPAQ